MTEYEWIRNIVEVCEAVQVKRGSDKDFYNNGKCIFCFDKEKFAHKVRGKTNGLASHAIAHLKNFDSGRAKMIADEIMNKIKNDKRFLDKFTVLNKKGDVLATGRSGLKYLNYKSVMNYLDYLNDTEFKQGGEFTEEDKYFIPHLKRIAKYYYEFVSKVYYDAIPVDRMSYQEIKNIIKVKNYISFGAEVKGQKRIIKLSVKDGWIMIVDMRQNVRTMIVNNSTTGNIWNKLKKLQIVPNDEPMRDIVNGRKPK